MNEFEDLLRETLHQDANPMPPADLTQRIVAAAIDVPRQASDGRKIWAGVAAAIAVAAIAWTLAQTGSIQATLPSAQVSFAQRSPAANGLDSKQEQVTLRSSATPMQVHPRFHTQRTMRIPPLEVEPLAIRPITVVSLESVPYTKKGRSE